jgi:glycosyltransferase involved in cell wall biosynthesis
MYKGLTVTVVMPAYNEAEGIFNTVQGYLRIPEVDEVVVVDNNSRDATAALAKTAGARVVREHRQGYGFACRKALESATSQYVVLVEPDGTFRCTDIHKFLAYAGEFDAVFGTRTSKACIWEGSNMGLFLRYGNCAVAKLLEFLHNGPCLTDVGCTYKLFRREALQRIAPNFRVGGSHFAPELMIVAIRSGLTCVEIPVHYQPRQGHSKITGNFWRAFRLGLRMIALILFYRFRRFKTSETVTDRAIAHNHAEHTGTATETGPPPAHEEQYAGTTRTV